VERPASFSLALAGGFNTVPLRRLAPSRLAVWRFPVSTDPVQRVFCWFRSITANL